MTNVLIVANNINPVDGGIATFIMNEFDHIDKRKVHIDFVVHMPQKQEIINYITSQGSEIFQISPFNFIKYRKFWKSFFRTHLNYDVIHVNSFDPTILYLGLARKYGITTIVHSHTTKMPKFDFVDFVCRINQFGSRFVADYFFGCSHKAIADRFGKRIEQSERSLMIPNGIDTYKFTFNQEARTRIRNEFSVGNRIAIGQVGRFEYQKNQEFSLKVFAALKKQHPEFVLIFIGNGVDEDKIKNEVSLLNLNDSVVFAGQRNDVEDCLSAFDMFLFPSEYEGLPIALIEAQCEGLPCFSTLEAIVDDADMGCNLLTRMSLNQSSEEWASAIYSKINFIDTNNRSIYPEFVRKKGFGIEESAKILEDFYVEHSRNNLV